MSNGRRWSVSLARKFIATGITAAAVFVICAGAGMANWAVAAFGIALVVLAVSIVIVSAVRGSARSFVRGTAHVLDATDPPANTPYGRCELQIVVEAPELAPAKVKIRDTRVPVAKWPDIGDTLPIRVAVEDPRHVRILWDEVRTHGEEAAEEERFNEYVQRIVDAELSGSGGDTLDEGVIPPVPADDEPLPPPAPAPVPRQKPSPRPRRATGVATVVAEPLVSEASEHSGDSEHGDGEHSGDGEHGGDGEPAAVAEATPPVEPDDRIEDDIVVRDIVPIEGASAVLGVPPSADGHASPADADAEAVKGLLATMPRARSDSAGTIHGVGVTLIVTDLQRTIDFYRDKLGFHVLDRSASSAVLASGTTRLMVRCVPDMPRVDRRVVHLNLEVGDVEAVYAELLTKDVKFIHRPRPVARGEHMELWAAAFRDPDGHGIALIKWQEI